MKNSSRDEQGFCVKCGTCNTVCPVYSVTGNEVHTPRGKQHLRSKITRGQTSAHYADIFSQCLLCGACLEACPRSLDTPELVIGVRSELPKLSGLSFLKYVSRKALVHPTLLSGLARIGAAADSLLGERLPEDSGLHLRLRGFNRETFKLPARGYIEQLKTGKAETEKTPGKQADRAISYFTGCLADHLQPEIAEATQRLVAETTGGKAHVPLEQTCCGMAALAAGRPDEARDLAKKNIRAFEQSSRPILTSCSSCYYQLQAYNELLGDDPHWRERAARFTGRLKEFSVFFLEAFSSNRHILRPTAVASAEKVLYHDPCHLRFKLHITEEPRELIRLLPDTDLQELPNGPRCCGQGGLFQLVHPTLARRVQESLMHDFSSLSARTVLTACSGCLLQWRQGVAAHDKDCNVEHPALFIARRLR